MVKKCLVCQKEFKTIPCLIKNGKGKFCSKKCFYTRNGKTEIKQCLNCGKEFKVKPSLNIIGRSKYCSSRCYGLFTQKSKEKECLICGKTFRKPPSTYKKGFGKYCSNKCKGLGLRGINRLPFTEEHKKRISEAKKGTIVSEETKKRMSIRFSGSGNAMYGKHHSQETRDKIRLKQLGIPESEETRKKHAERNKKLWLNPIWAQEQRKKMRAKWGLKPNKPEKEVTVILDNLFPHEWKYVGDGEFWLGGKNPDFMNVNGEKKLIELYGDWFHKGENPEDRINHFKKYGFETLVIWEHELKNKEELVNKLNNFKRGGEYV